MPVTTPDTTDAPLGPPSDPSAYESWFVEQVKLGLAEADDPQTSMVPHSEVMRELSELRAEWQSSMSRERNVA